MDHVLIKLAIERRLQLKKEIESFGENVNPLVIVQLPNDDEDLIEEGKPTKEDIVKEYLISQGVKADRIASWFTGKKKPVGLELNDSPYEYLLFKTAAGTGWDCPRAQVLVMFRDVKSEIFSTQVIGRILRVPIMNKEVSKVFRNGYIYTNFSRDAVQNADYESIGNKPKTLISYSKKQDDYIIDAKLVTDYLYRVDYGDLGKTGEFQQCLLNVFNKHFNFSNDDTMDALRDKLEAGGVDCNANFNYNIISNVAIHDFDRIGISLKGADELKRKLSESDVQKWFTLMITNILKEQTDEDCKIGNIVRSVPALKSALRLWFKKYALPSLPDDTSYRVFLNDVVNKKESSVFRMLITKTLKAYHPLLLQQLAERRRANEERQNSSFILKKMYAYTEEYEEISVAKCLFKPFFLHSNYNGKKTEEAFAKYLDQQENVEWWFKNGDKGKDWLAIRYENDVTGQDALFYPDWVFMKKDGTIGIFDTKGGITASDPSTKNKAEALQQRIKYLNSLNRETVRYVGGIVIQANGMWYYNCNETYCYRQGSTEGWEEMNYLFE